MKRSYMNKGCSGILLVGLMLMTSCHSGYKLTSIEGSRVEITSAYDNRPDEDATAILAPYKAKVDSLMKPVIGKSEVNMGVHRPESPLSNFAADILRQATVPYIGRKADLAVTNVGGLRNDLPEGEVTYGDIYEIFPFENTLCILTMSGKSILNLFTQIAKVHGEGISGAGLIITKGGDLVSATIDGKAIIPEQSYTLATLDYLSEGNDGMPAFLEATDKQCPDGARIRDIVVNYIKDMTKQGKSVTASVEGRITVQ